VVWYHKSHDWIPADAAFSLPVHPLQLYFLAAAGATLAIILWQQRQALSAGTLALLFYTLFFSSTALLEPFRQNQLTLNNWIVPGAAALAACLLLARGITLSKPSSTSAITRKAANLDPDSTWLWPGKSPR
jgi:prolipoprotein diacylglyceryltransferase